MPLGPLRRTSRRYQIRSQHTIKCSAYLPVPNWQKYSVLTTRSPREFLPPSLLQDRRKPESWMRSAIDLKDLIKHCEKRWTLPHIGLECLSLIHAPQETGKNCYGSVGGTHIKD